MYRQMTDLERREECCVQTDDRLHSSHLFSPGNRAAISKLTATLTRNVTRLASPAKINYNVERVV